MDSEISARSHRFRVAETSRLSESRPAPGLVTSISKTKYDLKAEESSFVINAIFSSLHYQVPSVDLEDFRAVLSERSIGEIIELGSGLTSKVIHYVTKDETKEVVPPGTAVALKLFKTGKLTYDEATIACSSSIAAIVIQEIRAYRHPLLVKHPNIAKLLFLGWHGNNLLPVLGIELGEYGTLDYIIRNQSPVMPNVDKIHVTVDLALGLEAVHRAGFGYGDLKPDNIIISAHKGHGRRLIAKLIDFGGMSQSSVKPNRPRHYTPLWTAPEVLRADPDVDWVRADIYSYGLVLASLWASRDRGYGLSLLKKPTSCFLNSFIRISMEEEDIDDYLLLIKSQNDVVLMMKEKLGETLMTEDDQQQIAGILSLPLQAHFWLRPDSLSLIELLAQLALKANRQIL